MYKVIPEQLIKDSAFLLLDEEGEDNSFMRMLKAAQTFREADLTPIYVVDTATMNVVVIAKETYRKKLH